MATKMWLAVVCVVFVTIDTVAAQPPDFGLAPSRPPAATGDFYPPPDISPHAEQWRYRCENGLWWYFAPDRRWLYWSQGRWVEYLPPGKSNTPPGLRPPMPPGARPRMFGFRGVLGTGWGPRVRGAPIVGYPGFGVY